MENYTKRLRQNFNEKANAYGNSLYEGLGDLLATDVNSKGIAALGLAGILLGGCGATGKAYSGSNSSPKDHTLFYKKYDIKQVDSTRNRYGANILGIMGKGYYLVKANDNGCIGMFDIDKVNRTFFPSTNEEKISSGESIDGKKGLYLILNSKNAEGKNLKSVTLNTAGNRAKTAKIPKIKDMVDKKIINEKDIFGLKINEKNFGYMLPTVKIPGFDESYIVKMKNEKEGEYGFYIIPIKPVDQTKKSSLEIDSEGKITIINPDEIYNPQFVPYEDVAKTECMRGLPIKKEKKKEKEDKENKTLEIPLSID